MLDRFPDLVLAADYSHWVVVTQRLLDTEGEILRRCAPRASTSMRASATPRLRRSATPREPSWAAALAAHESWWAQIFAAPSPVAGPRRTVVPEFGPEPYRVAGAPCSDEVNEWMAARLALLHSHACVA